MYVKSTLLVIDMKHIPKVRDKHWFLIQKNMYISANFSKWHLKRKVLGKMKVLRNQSINLCSEKCNLGQIQIASQEMCFEQQKSFSVSSSTRSLGSLNQHVSQCQCTFGIITSSFYAPSCHYLFQSPKRAKRVLMIVYWIYLSEKTFKKIASRVLVTKKALYWPLPSQINFD